jgi:hypothetical protein
MGSGQPCRRTALEYLGNREHALSVLLPSRASALPQQLRPWVVQPHLAAMPLLLWGACSRWWDILMARVAAGAAPTTAINHAD